MRKYVSSVDNAHVPGFFLEILLKPAFSISSFCKVFFILLEMLSVTRLKFNTKVCDNTNFHYGGLLRGVCQIGVLLRKVIITLNLLLRVTSDGTLNT